MAKIGSAWGIDIGQCALKAVRCAPSGDDPNKVVADAFDYIEYPKILTQPEADPIELVREALLLFLSRNDKRARHYKSYLLRCRLFTGISNNVTNNNLL